MSALAKSSALEISGAPTSLRGAILTDAEVKEAKDAKTLKMNQKKAAQKASKAAEAEVGLKAAGLYLFELAPIFPIFTNMALLFDL